MSIGGNPYRRAWKRRAHNRRGVEGWATTIAGISLPLVAAALLMPLLQPVFLPWLSSPQEAWAAGMSGVTLRVALLVLAVLSLDVYSALVRADDRAVLAVLPVDAGVVARVEVTRVAARRWWLLPFAGIVLAPVALAGAWSLYLGGLWVVFGAVAVGLWLSSWIHLQAIIAAESEGWAPLLDAIRGVNHRPQAAFLYAPGLILLVSGALVQLACVGLEAAHNGGLWGWAGPLPMLVLAFFGWRGTPDLARSAWFRGSLVLAEIDARYAALQDPEEGRRVYLDWSVRFLPSTMGRWAMKDLRHGWRARRSWITGAWLVALGAFAAGWTAADWGPARAMDVSLAGAWLCASIGVWMELDEPDFLRVWLPQGGAGRHLARVWVLFLWVQPPAWFAATSVAMRRGLADGGLVLAVCLGSAFAAACLSWLCGRLGGRGLAAYAPLAAILAATTALWVEQ